MVKKSEEKGTYNKRSIYSELKEFYDINSGILYSYQDFETAGIREFKIITNKIRPLHNYEKNRLANELMRILFHDIEKEEELINISGYIAINPIINYYDNFSKILEESLEVYSEFKVKLKKHIRKLLLETKNSEEVKLGLIIAAICKVDNIKEILDVFSIHNDYLYYVIKAYEYLGKSNNVIFNMAKKSYGYGKVFCLMSLKPTTYEIRKWMIEDGCNNNVGITELLSYSMLSLEVLEYLEHTEFDSRILETFSKAFSTLLSDYGIDDVKDFPKVCNKLLKIIDKINGGIYSLYAVVSMIYSIEAAIIDDYKNKRNSNTYKFNDDYKKIIQGCKEICKKDIWQEVIAKEIGNKEIESSVLISCI